MNALEKEVLAAWHAREKEPEKREEKESEAASESDEA